MAVKGPRARALLQALLDAVSDLVPGDVDIAATGHGRGCHLQASRFAEPSQISTEDPFGGAISGASATLGLGPWVPFLPRQVAAKLTVQDALETIQDAISTVARTPWPGPDYKVRVDAQPSGVRTWFDNGERQIEVATISYDLASK